MNTSYQIAPWADVLYAMDKVWWDKHWREVCATFPGQRASICNFPHREAHVVKLGGAFAPGGNSGAGALSLALRGGAETVLLLGYDAQRTGGRVHWHGDHPRGLGNAGAMNKWPGQFAALKIPDGCRVVNCSRATALTCFERGDLDEWLRKS